MPEMIPNVSTKAKQTENQSSHRERTRSIAQRCRREIQNLAASTSHEGYHPIVAEFLHQPFRNGAVTGGALDTSKGTKATQHLMKLLAPFLQENLTTGHRTIDRCEPVATGMEASLRWIAKHPHWSTSLSKGMLLHSLLPLYLTTSSNGLPFNGQAKNSTALAESVGLLRNYVALTQLDRLLEGDLGQWMEKQVDSWDGNLSRLHLFAFDVQELSQFIWLPSPSIQVLPEKLASHEDSFAMQESRRLAFWSIVKQWLSDAPHIALPKELAIERLSWPTLRSHFQQLLELLKAESVSNAIATVAGEKSLVGHQNAEVNATKILDDCSSAVEQALVATIGGPSSHGETLNKPKGNSLQDLAAFEPNSDQSVVEIRSSSDPTLVRSLDEQLSDCRGRQGSIALVVARTLHRENSQQPEGKLAVWQRSFVEYLRINMESEELRGFVTADGELSLLLEDIDRPVAMAIVREGLQEAMESQRKACGLGSEANLPLVAGISYVASPARSFKIQQLIDSGWRCLEGATNQGSGAVKSIEVY